MKIIYITPGVFDKGGISRYGRYQIQALRDLFGKRNIFTISLTGKGSDYFEDPFDVDWIANGANTQAKMRFMYAIHRSTRSFKPDYLFSAHVNLSGVAGISARINGAKLITQVYGSEIWRSMRMDAKWGLTSSDLVISDCHFTAHYMEENRLRSPGSTKVLWDCVDINRFSPGKPSADVIDMYNIPDPENNLNILTLGRMNKDTASNKGYDRLLKVFATLTDINQTQLIFAGTGNQIPDLMEMASNLGVDDRVHFIGSIHEDHLTDVYRCAHVFSLVSNRTEGHGEGIPLTPLEAAACGLPIIVGDQDGSIEAVEHDKNGYVIDPFDFTNHSDYIRRLLLDDELREKLGLEARKRIEKFHSFEGFKYRLSNIFESL